MIDSSEDANQTKGVSPGRMLRKARESKNLSTADAANELHLRPSIVTAIEQGQYELVPGLIFLKGYIRSYARLVGLNEATVIAALDSELQDIQTGTETQDSENTGKRKLSVWLWLLFIIVLLAGAAFLMQKELPIFNPDISAIVDAGENVGAEKEHTGSAGGRAGSIESMQGEGDLHTEAQAELGMKSETDYVQDEPVVTAIDAAELQQEGAENTAAAGVKAADESGVDSEQPASKPLDSGLQVQDDSVQTAGETKLADEPQPFTYPAETNSEPQVRPETTDEIAGVVATGMLEMYFRGDSWVQVTDATGKRLVSALKKQGSETRVSGQTPLTVVIGAASVSDVRFNGKVVDFNQYRVRNNRVKLVLQ